MSFERIAYPSYSESPIVIVIIVCFLQFGDEDALQELLEPATGRVSRLL